MRYDDNLTTERETFVTHLECSMTGEHYKADEVHNLSRAGKPLLVRYDLDGVNPILPRMAERAQTKHGLRLRKMSRRSIAYPAKNRGRHPTAADKIRCANLV